MSPSLDYDSSPAFSPDGARIAFVHVQAEKTPPDFYSHRSGRPWSIWTADVKTGQGRRVWVADAGPGSVFHTTTSWNNDTPSTTNLFWTNHDDLVFPWEKSGWLHLYAVPVQGGTARALTVGKFEVTHFVFSEDRKGDRRHRAGIREIRQAGKEPRMKTQGIVGGVGPESTVDYYRSPVQIWREEAMDEKRRGKPLSDMSSKWGTKFCTLSRGDSWPQHKL